MYMYKYECLAPVMRDVQEFWPADAVPGHLAHIYIYIYIYIAYITYIYIYIYNIHNKHDIYTNADT